MTEAKPIIGLCGGIGSGKSAVAAAFQRFGCVVADSDRMNHEVLRRVEVLDELAGWWGPGVREPDGLPNRRRIAEIIFADESAKLRLQSLVYPLIDRLRADIISSAVRQASVKAVVLDSPLLFESNLDRMCDAVVFVQASEERRLARLHASRGWSAEELHRREAHQLPLEEKRARSQYVVLNDGPVSALDPQVADIVNRIVSSRSSAR